LAGHLFLANDVMKLLALSTIMNDENMENGIEFPPFRIPVKKFLARQARAVAILVPAMGTTASFYQPFADELANRGVCVLLPELPGTGQSRPRPSWKVDYGYRDLVEIYLPGMVREAKEAGQGAPVVLIGHSLGAHAGTLAVATGSIDVDALVTIAGGNIHYRNWDGIGAARVLLAGALFSFSTRVFGYMPGQYFGFGGPQARTLIREWAKIIRTGRFSHIADDSGFSGQAPTLSIGFEGDTFAPEKSIKSLASVLDGEVEILAISGKGNPHSSWARNPETTISTLDRWLQRTGCL
jgi:predicted alpha/beta hydrolase